MRWLLLPLGALVVVGCAAASTVPSSTSNLDEAVDAGGDADAAACFSATGVDGSMHDIGVNGGGDSMESLTTIIGVVASTTAGGSFELALPQSNSAATLIQRTFPSLDTQVEYTAQIDPDDFTSNAVTFLASAGSVTCGPVTDGDYPCTFTDLVLTPKDGSDANACATGVLPAFTLHVKVGIKQQ